MVTIITVSGNPIMIASCEDARMVQGKLVCLSATGERLLSFDPADVMAFAVEKPGIEPAWVMGGSSLFDIVEPAKTPGRSPLRFVAALRPTFS